MLHVNDVTMVSSLPVLNNVGGWGESDETSRIFCGDINFLEMNGEISLYGGTKSNYHKDGG